MSDLFASLNAAARALEAQRMGLDVVGQNIANVNSPGYTRRTLTFSPIPPTDKYSAGAGVRVTDIHAQRDLLIERRLRLELSAEQRDAALAQALGVAELALGRSGMSVDADLSAFFDAFSSLAENPTSAVARNEVQSQAAVLAASLRNLSAGFDAARREADRQIGAAVDEINNLVDRVAALNRTIVSAGAVPELKLAPQDEQEQLVRELARLVDIAVLRRNDGGVDISVGNGRALVVGASSYQIEKNATGPDGYLELASGDFSLTGEVSGGRLGGLLQARDTVLPAYLSQLDSLAYALVAEVNTLHASGYDLSGAPGGDFFSFASSLSGSAGAAAAIRLDPAIAANGSLIAAAGTTEAGGNTIARSIAALRDAKVLAGGTATLNDGWGQIVYQVGRDVRDARSSLETRRDIVNQVEMLRDQVSGISLDEEAALMLRFQRAFEANARFFRVIDETLDMLMALA